MSSKALISLRRYGSENTISWSVGWRRILRRKYSNLADFGLLKLACFIAVIRVSLLNFPLLRLGFIIAVEASSRRYRIPAMASLIFVVVMIIDDSFWATCTSKSGSSSDTVGSSSSFKVSSFLECYITGSAASGSVASPVSLAVDLQMGSIKRSGLATPTAVEGRGRRI